MSRLNILILGSNGMLGSQLYAFLSNLQKYKVFGTIRDHRDLHLFPISLRENIVSGVSVENINTILQTIVKVKPDLIINCIGIIKQTQAAKDPLKSIMINALFPHQLGLICEVAGIRLLHISTDCVFDGMRGMYLESDAASPSDLYGRSKLLGEITAPGCLTIRTSIIGHELNRGSGLVEWFLGQTGTVRGYSQAVYSGLPTIELARIIAKYIIDNPGLSGIYHISSEPITKFDLLHLIKNRYLKDIVILPDDAVQCNRSLNSNLFRKLTGYHPLSWTDLIETMYRDYSSSPLYNHLKERGAHDAPFKG